MLAIDQIEQIVNNFSKSISELGPQYSSVCAVHDALAEETVTQGVGVQDERALLQLYASLLTQSAIDCGWSIDDLEIFLSGVFEAVRPVLR